MIIDDTVLILNDTATEYPSAGSNSSPLLLRNVISNATVPVRFLPSSIASSTAFSTSEDFTGLIESVVPIGKAPSGASTSTVTPLYEPDPVISSDVGILSNFAIYTYGSSEYVPSSFAFISGTNVASFDTAFPSASFQLTNS